MYTNGTIRSHNVSGFAHATQVRTARSVELVAQRRRVEAHMGAQSKAVKQQAVSGVAGIVACAALEGRRKQSGRVLADLPAARSRKPNQPRTTSIHPPTTSQPPLNRQASFDEALRAFEVEGRK
jgi:hypothetical protein